MIPAELDIKAKLDELANMNALFVVGLKEHTDKAKMQCRMVAWADMLTVQEMLFFSRLLFAFGIGLHLAGPADMQDKAEELLGTAKHLLAQALEQKEREKEGMGPA